MVKPLLVLSDTHLSRQYGTSTSRHLAQLVEAHPDCELILAGDIFDLSLDPAGTPLAYSLQAALQPHPELNAALRQHIRQGGCLSFIPGNHDSTLSGQAALTELRHQFEAQNDNTLQLYPWFVRRGDLHIEHGHLYDPDCAPNHPLADANPSHEGLGTALMRRFVSPHNAFFFAHKNQTTMSSGLSRAFKEWGPRAPWVISCYFRIVFGLWSEATFKGATVSQEKAQGHSRLPAYAETQQIPWAALESLLQEAITPTHHSGKSMFYRLYFDRILAAFSILAGAGALTSAGLGAALAVTPLVTASGSLLYGGALLSSIGAGYLTANVAKQKNRYGDAVVGQLEAAAGQIRCATDAKLVIFGHSHVATDQFGYVNLGSFGYAHQQRPYLLVDSNQKHSAQVFQGS